MFFDHSSRMFWLISYSSFYSDVAVCQPIISYIFFGRVIISVLDCSVFPLCLLVLSRLFCRSSAALCSSSTVSLFSFRFCCPFFLPFPNVCWDNSTFSRQIVLSFYCGAVFNRLCPPHQQPSREERSATKSALFALTGALYVMMRNNWSRSTNFFRFSLIPTPQESL